MKSIKLNIGAGSDHKAGWINVDIDPATNPDKIVDLQKKLPYKSNQVSEVLLQDVLEHLTKEDARIALTEIYRILKPKGKLTLRIPNIRQITQQFRSDPEVMMEFLYGNTEHNGVWGAHKYGYTEEIITKMLKRSGFFKIDIKEKTTNYLVTCNKSTKVLKVKIALIQQAPDWGGAEEWISTLASQWRGQKIPVIGITNHQGLKQSWQKSGVKTIQLPFILDIIGNTKGLIKSIILLPYAIYWYFKTINHLKKQGTNCIIMSGFSEKMLVSWIANFYGIPAVWFEYGPLSSVFSKNAYLPKIIYRLTKHIPSRVITISHHTKNSLIQDCRVSLSKIRLIHPGVDIPANKPKLQSRFVAGSLSRIASEKGQRLLVKSWEKVIEKIPTAKLVIAGKGPDESKLKSLIHEKGLQNSVKLEGFVQNKPSFYKKISLFIFPSIWELEGFGIVQAEALSYGVPVVSVDNGPAKEIINGHVGKLSGRSPQKLADSIIAMISSKDKSKMSRQAYDLAESNYNATTQALKVLNEIKDVVKES